MYLQHIMLHLLESNLISFQFFNGIFLQYLGNIFKYTITLTKWPLILLMEPCTYQVVLLTCYFRCNYRLVLDVKIPTYLNNLFIYYVTFLFTYVNIVQQDVKYNDL